MAISPVGPNILPGNRLSCTGFRAVPARGLRFQQEPKGRGSWGLVGQHAGS